MPLDISQPRWTGFGGSSLPSTGFGGYGSPPASFNSIVPGQFGNNDFGFHNSGSGSQFSFFTPGSSGKSLLSRLGDGFVAGIPGAVLSGLSSFALDAYSRYKNKQMLYEQRAYDERMTDKANAYNSPIAQKARLMAAGLSEKAAIEAISGGVQGYQPVQGSQPLPYQDAPGFNPMESMLQSSGLAGEQIRQVGDLLRNESSSESIIEQKLQNIYTQQTLAARISQAIDNSHNTRLLGDQLRQTIDFNNERFPIDMALQKNELALSNMESAKAEFFSTLSRSQRMAFGKAHVDAILATAEASAKKAHAESIYHDWVSKNRSKVEKGFQTQLDLHIRQNENGLKLSDLQVKQGFADLSQTYANIRLLDQQSSLYGFEIATKQYIQKMGYDKDKADADGLEARFKADEWIWKDKHFDEFMNDYLNVMQLNYDKAYKSDYDRSRLDAKVGPFKIGRFIADGGYLMRNISPFTNMLH